MIGFVDKKDSQELLSQKTSGTFLLRFSESEVGGVTIAWVTDRNELTSGKKLMIGKTSNTV